MRKNRSIRLSGRFVSYLLFSGLVALGVITWFLSKQSTKQQLDTRSQASEFAATSLSDSLQANGESWPKLNQLLQPLCRYYNQSLDKHQYLPGCPDAPPGYEKQWIEAYIYKENSVPGLRKICAYRNSNQDYIYNLSCDDQSQYGYTKVPFTGYAFAEARAHTIPICRYWSESRQAHLYSALCDEQANHQLNWVEAYVYPESAVNLPIVGMIENQESPTDRMLNGWAKGSEIKSDSRIGFYLNARPGEPGSVLLDKITTSVPRPEIIAKYAVAGNTGFLFQPSGSVIKGDQPQKIYAFVLDAKARPFIDGELLNSPFYFEPTIKDVCTSPQSDCTAEIISEPVVGDSIKVTFEQRLAGAIGSIRWQNKEFILSGGAGAAAGYLVHVNGQGECNNPTQAGSVVDQTGGRHTTSTSQLVIQDLSKSRIKLTTKMAYWLPPQGESVIEGKCSSGNTKLLSDYQIQVEYGFSLSDMPNVLVADAELTVPENVNQLGVGHPHYLNFQFSDIQAINPVTGEGQKLPLDQFSRQFLPLIASTPDGTHAMGVLVEPAKDSGEFQFNNHNTGKYPEVIPARSSIVIDPYSMFYRPIKAGEKLKFRSYLIIGSRDQVRNDLMKLAAKPQFNWLRGFQAGSDDQSCNTWGWVADVTNHQTVVSMIAEAKLKSGAVVQSLNLKADQTNDGVKSEYGISGQHGYVGFFDKTLLNRPTEVYVYGKTLAGQLVPLTKNPQVLNCNQTMPIGH